MNRPELLQEIRDAYQTFGLKPTRSSFFIKRKRGGFACPLTALALSRGAVTRKSAYLGLDTAFNPAYVWACNELGGDWTSGFMDAVDGREKAGDEPEYLEGFAAGEPVAQDLFEPLPPQQAEGNPHA
jgi:hypothetical protein